MAFNRRLPLPCPYLLVTTSDAQYQTGTAIAQARTLWQQVQRTQFGVQPKSERLLLLIQKITEMYREVIPLTDDCGYAHLDR
ncbi:hypothetical protein [Gloeothece verrucosa]|uniref:hypothetical protein n=1 Tax=Gloeothece verrucosa TaxID=2546359 RepID=UPI00017E2C67|nr:hypothetical protein [Gloeothece verrucosa]